MPNDLKQEREYKLELEYHKNGSVTNVRPQSDPTIEQVRGYSRYMLAADLGQANDFSGVIAIKDEALPIVDKDERLIVGPRKRTVVYADKFKGVNYVDVVDHLIRLKNAEPFVGKCDLCIDGTSIGRVVSDMLHDQSVPHWAIQMTAGQEWRKASARYVNAGKTFMIENLAVMFAAGEIEFAHDLALRPEIESDLASFTMQTTHAGNSIITQARSSSGHGDLGIALIVGAFATQYLKPRNIVSQAQLRGWY